VAGTDDRLRARQRPWLEGAGQAGIPEDLPGWTYEDRTPTDEEWLAERAYRRGYHQATAFIAEALKHGMTVQSLESLEHRVAGWRGKVSTRRPTRRDVPPRQEPPRPDRRAASPPA
jgi:hypothetical protein